MPKEFGQTYDGTIYRAVGNWLGERYFDYGFTKGTAQEVDFLVDLLELCRGARVLDLIFTRSGRFSKLWKKEGRLARFRVWRKRCQNGGSQLDTSGEAHDDSPSRDVTGEARGLVC